MSQKKKTKNKKPKHSLAELSQYILSLFKENVDQAHSVKQVIKSLGFRDRSTKDQIKQTLFKLEEEGKVRQNSKGNFMLAKDSNRKGLTGKVDYVSSSYAYVIVEDLEEDVWVKSSNLKGALDGDEVQLRIFSNRRRGGSRPEGEVIKVISRARDEFVGKIELSEKFAFVIADYRKMHHHIYINSDHINGARDNDKVIVKIYEWPVGDKKPTGSIVRVLGKAGEHTAEMHSIMAEFGLPFEFESKILHQANRIKDGVTKEEIKQRKDFRKITTFTIDPEDAKDFDDALSIRQLKNGNFEVGVHIADVSHYVRPGTLIDKEGLERATSVYLVDRTIPMLPEKLSNELCSLRPKEEKLTFSAVFELDSNGKIAEEWFGKTVIKSDRRFSYEEAQEILEKVDGDYARELVWLNELALKLRIERFMRGAVNFETVEVKFKLDEQGKPLGVVPKIRKDTHKMIEEFMLLANKRVAEFIYNLKKGKKKLPYVYRIHDQPDPEKLNAFSVFARKFGHNLILAEGNIAQSLNILIEDIEGKPEQNVLQNLAIRSMAKAKYSTEEKGHFGLAFPHYTHFTSPIRRYPDMMSHRLLQHYLNGGRSVNRDDYEVNCEHSSEREKRAADAERASIKYKQVEYMQSMIGEVMDGIISGVTEWGIYVEMAETRSEGMVRMSELIDDYYEYDEKNFRVIGKRNKKMFTLGDDVKVRVLKTDIDRRTIDLEFVDEKH